MGRNGFTVGFSNADPNAPLTPKPLSPFAKMQDALGDLIDDVSVAELKVSAAHAERARVIERTRVWAVAAALELPGDEAPGDESAGSHQLSTRELSPREKKAREEMAHRSFVAQLSGALRMSEGATRNLIWASECLVNSLPLTLEYLSDGLISLRHAQILVDQVANVGPELARVLEQDVLCHAGQQTPPQFERSVRRAAEKLNLADMVERQQAAAEKRHNYIEPMQNGMGRFVLEAPIAQIVAADNFITDRAKSMQVEGELRTLAQLKADVASDLLLNVDSATGKQRATTTAGNGNSPTDRYRTIRPTLLVTVPVLTMLRKGQGAGTGTGTGAGAGAGVGTGAGTGTVPDTDGSEQPQEFGILEGYGPIDPQTARELAAEAKSMIRILTHPETGAALAIGRSSYRIPKRLRYWLRFRDGTCRFPGCSRAAKFADIDHGEEWFADHGGTDHFTLNCLCPGHHALKTIKDWKPVQDPQGTGEIMWITPTGHLLWDYPENTVSPIVPDEGVKPDEGDAAA